MFADKDIQRFWSKIDRKDDITACWDWTACIQKIGYGGMRYNGKIWKAHRISFMIHHNREIITGMHILHSCDNRKCCNPHHLREGTHAENMRDMKEKGRRINPPHNRGDDSTNHILTSDQVKVIRHRFNTETITHTQLAAEYNVGRGTISDIIKRRTWTHI